MKLADLLLNQNIMIQFVFGEQKIEFSSKVVENDDEVAYATAYKHNGSELQLNINEGSGVICNVFVDDPKTGQRKSWRNVELTTENRHDGIFYCIKTRGFNNVAKLDDRRYNERVVIDVDGIATDVQNEINTDITVHDVSGVGVSFYAPKSYSPKSQQLLVRFTDKVGDKTFSLNVECSITRTSVEEYRTTVGCRLVGENRDYQIYRLLKYLRGRNGNKLNVLESKNVVDSSAESAVDENKATAEETE